MASPRGLSKARETVYVADSYSNVISYVMRSTYLLSAIGTRAREAQVIQSTQNYLCR
jgi:hypothetical protein